MLDLSSSYVLVGLAVGTLALYKLITAAHTLSYIPTVGPSWPLLSYLGAFRLAKHGREMIQEGYDKYKGGVFKIAMLDKWMVVISGPKLIEELRNAPDDQVSFLEAASEAIQILYTFGPEPRDNPYHVELIRRNLTRQIGTIFSDIIDEIQVASADIIPTTGKEWTSVPALPAIQQIVSRVSSRVFVGLPMCRHEDYVKLSVTHTMDVGKVRRILSYTPRFLRPLVAPFVTDSKRSIARGVEYLRPIIEQRRKMLEELGDDWSDKPNDMLMWLIEEGTSRGQDIETIVKMIMVTNFAAIHTTSSSFTHALYHLAAHPGYMQPLREEAETVVNEDGWTKLSLQKMRKIDSFLKESQRMNGINGVSLMRMVLRDITFSDGTFLPAGTFVTAAAISEHHDSEYYSHPDIFDPWRFSNMRGEDGEGLRHQFVSTSVDYIPFGHGKHACPGRFFAANEMKAMLAHVVLNYDVKFEQEGVRPKNMWFSITIMPSPTGKVMFRKRQD